MLPDKSMDCVAIIMAGGKSSRMRAGGCSTHKALRTVNGTTLLDHNIVRICECGIKDIWLAISDSELELRVWTESRASSPAAAFGSTVRIIRERDPLGTIGAARHIPGKYRNVLVVNVDNLCDIDLSALVQYHLRTRAALTIATHNASFRIPFGRIETQGGRVLGYSEKPHIAVTISSGFYVLTRKAIEHIPTNCRTDVPELVNRLVDGGELVASFQHAATWIDVNDEAALAQAELFFGHQLRSRAAGD